MDNLTHSLVGALIGQAGLKRRTGLAMPALIIGANLPDMDATCVAVGDMQHLALRRGLTHGPIAWLLLPLVLAAALWWWDRWQARRGKRPPNRLPVHFGWLYALSLVGTLTHPALDWLNVYGIRLLSPFSSRWFYGDVLFIIDLWLWLGLGLATWLSLRREQRGGEWRRPARIALSVAAAYVGLNAAITTAAEQRVKTSAPRPRQVIASPVPLRFWQREVLRQDGSARWTVDGRPAGNTPLARCDLAAASLSRKDVNAFLVWSRAPVIDRRPDGTHVLGDARYYQAGRFSVELPPGTCAEPGGQ